MDPAETSGERSRVPAPHECDAHIDPDDVGIDPAGLGIERVEESILFPRAIAVNGADVAGHNYAVL